MILRSGGGGVGGCCEGTFGDYGSFPQGVVEADYGEARVVDPVEPGLGFDVAVPGLRVVDGLKAAAVGVAAGGAGGDGGDGGDDLDCGAGEVGGGADGVEGAGGGCVGGFGGGACFEGVGCASEKEGEGKGNEGTGRHCC